MGEPKDYGFPRVGDHLFRPSKTGRNSLVSSDHNDRRSQLIRGYQSAAEILAVASVKDTGYNDTLIFPVVFLYRHLLEVILKEMLEVSGKRFKVKWKRDHKLPDLWGQAQEVLAGMDLNDWAIPNKVVTELLQEFGKIDQQSFSFRYHTDKSGNLINLGKDPIDLVNFIETADRLASYLGALSSELMTREQFYLESEAEYRLQD